MDVRLLPSDCGPVLVVETRTIDEQHRAAAVGRELARSLGCGGITDRGDRPRSGPVFGYLRSGHLD
jgi:hypothetical protein